jgi:Ca-activated chloride channel family protein
VIFAVVEEKKGEDRMNRRIPEGALTSTHRRTVGLGATAVLTSCLLLALAAPEVRAQAGLLVPTSTGQPDASVLSLRDMAIDIGVARGYARVNVRQVFENHTDRIQEGTYRFRLPPSAAVGDFAVWDGLVRIPGVILEKQRARAIYRELTTQRIDPGLLQQGEEDEGSRPSGGTLFSVRVAPIPARGTKRLELQFQQEVPWSVGAGEFRLALAPPDGEPTTASHLTIKVDSGDAQAMAGAMGLPLTKSERGLAFTGTKVRLDRDIVVRLTPASGPALRLAAFRNPEGTLPDGVALAPWERPSDVPPEKDGFFLFEALPGPTATGADRPRRSPVSVVAVFDTSLSHRWSGLEAAWSHLTRLTQSLSPSDRFALVSFDNTPTTVGRFGPATPAAVGAALEALRARPLSPGTNVAAAILAAREAVGEGRIVLLTDGTGHLQSRDLRAARGTSPLFTILTGEESPEALRNASTQVLGLGATDVDTDLFFRRILDPEPARQKPGSKGPPFRVTGGDALLRDVYAVLAQPPAPGQLSGWIGRYAKPQPRLTWELPLDILPPSERKLEAPLPESALEARDLPRRWARARVDHLLGLIEAEGERREWIDEIIALSKRYKFVTPYTAFLAAPRSLLRPRRIQPGDPVLRVECDPGTVSATALFPFGLRLPLVRRGDTHLWEGRFLVPEGFADGRHHVRLVLRDASGALVSEEKSFVVDGRAPSVQPELPVDARAGETVTIAARADADVIFLSARIGASPPVPLRWDASRKLSTGRLLLPVDLVGSQDVYFEAVDGAHNMGFARARLEVRP